MLISNSLTIMGLGTSTMISVAGGEYSVNNGAFTTIDGFINSNDTVVLRHTSSPIALTTVDSILNIGGVSDTFSTTTASSTISDGESGSFAPVFLLGLLLVVRIMRGRSFLHSAMSKD